MSFAVIQTGGKQYKVKAGEILKVEKLEDSKENSKIEFNEILAYGDDKNLELAVKLLLFFSFTIREELNMLDLLSPKT